jgi:sugar transferase (PEP-CTERM/EpsH1 system associated)
VRTLFVSNTVPYPPNSGSKQRAYHLLRGVARVSEVTLFSLMESEEEREYANTLREFCQDIHFLPREAWGHGASLKLPKPLIWGRSALEYLDPTVPALLRWYESPVGKRLLEQLCSAHFDLVWAERLPSMAILPSHLDCRVFVDLDDLQHRKLAHRLRHATWDRLLPFHGLEFLKLRRLETRLAGLPYEFVVCSEVDRQFFNGNGHTWVVPNGVELPSLPPSPRVSENAATLVFVGTMNYEPNVDAVRFFASGIFPLIRRRLPDARFLIVGRDPTEDVLRLQATPGITVTGTVASVEDYLNQASVVVAPIRFGGGTRIKILEAMAHHKAVVSTTVGAEGIRGEPGKHFLAANDDESFAEACALLLRNPTLRERIGAEGYSLVRTHYTWDRIEGQVAAMAQPRTNTVEEMRATFQKRP